MFERLRRQDWQAFLILFAFFFVVTIGLYFEAKLLYPGQQISCHPTTSVPPSIDCEPVPSPTGSPVP